jgi:hypothetical protein
MAWQDSALVERDDGKSGEHDELRCGSRVVRLRSRSAVSRFISLSGRLIIPKSSKSPSRPGANPTRRGAVRRGCWPSGLVHLRLSCPNARNADAGREFQKLVETTARLAQASQMRVGGDQHPMGRMSANSRRGLPDVQCDARPIQEHRRAPDRTTATRRRPRLGEHRRSSSA